LDKVVQAGSFRRSGGSRLSVLTRRRADVEYNILTRHIKPVARKLGLGLVNWQVLRRTYATWMIASGADPKAVQAQMRHASIKTTLELYAQFVPVAQQQRENASFHSMRTHTPFS